MARTYIQDAFKKKGEVELFGWVHDTRDLSKIKFLVLKDITGRIQGVGLKNETPEKVFNLISKISRESVVKIKGELKDSKQAPGGKEILIKDLEIIAEAKQPLPIDVSDHSKTELPKRLDFRFLDLHREKTQAIFKVNSAILQAYRDFMIEEGAVECLFPSIISSSSEGGTNLFKMKYFVIEVLGRCVQYIVKRVIEENKKELELLEVKLKIPSVKYMTFHEVSEIMKKHKCHVGKDDLSPESEKKLGELYSDTIVFVHDWPLSGKPFYIMPFEKSSKEQLSKGFDAIYKGTEISSGGQRIHIPELLIERLKAKGLNPKDFKDYVDK